MKRILFLAILLAGCGGEGLDNQVVQGVPITATVPYAHESIQDIIDREKCNPTPPRGDWEAPSHYIPRNVEE